MTKAKSKSKAKGATRTTSRPPTKHQSSSQSADHSPVRTASESRLHVRPEAVPATPAPRSDTKHARIIAMLRSPAGATIAAMMTATDWQPHSVRGFLAGIVRKKLGLIFVSEASDSGRVYRVKDGKASSTAAECLKRAA